MDNTVFGTDAWKTALDKYAEATALTVELYGADGQMVLRSAHSTPLVALFREHEYQPGLFAECARRCLAQTFARPAVLADEHNGLTVIGTSLVLEGAIVGAAVAGYALAGFSNVPSVQRWARSAQIPFYRLWEIVRQQSPVPERRLMLHGELLKVLGDALLRENYRTRQHEETVVKLNAAAAAKDEFLAVLSHELRAPLAPIVGWAGVMKSSETMEHVHLAAEAIERNALLQSKMVDDLLDSSRIEHRAISLDLQVHDLSALLRAAVETTIQNIERKAIRLELTNVPEPLFVQGDAGRLQQVFRNIISNAVKFTPGGGSIRITVSREADTAQVVIADTGVGIAPEFLPFVFDIFRQQEQGLRRQYDGLGIGLALVKQLTALHKGTVTIASAGVGRGAEVAVRLPLTTTTETPVGRDVLAGTGLQASALANLSILVVEDSEDAGEFLRVLLQRLGVTVSVARDGREALDTLQEFDPDVVLCDLRMPRMDGYEFLRELHRRPEPVHPPVVAMSGLASKADLRRTREAGFEAHLKKPFDIATVIAAVDAAIHHRQEQQPGEQPPVAISPDAPQMSPPAEIAQRPPARTVVRNEARTEARTERRRVPRAAGDKLLGSAKDKTRTANSSDSREPVHRNPKRQP